MSAEKNNKTDQPSKEKAHVDEEWLEYIQSKEWLDELETLNKARTQGEWEYGHFESPRDNEYAVHVKGAEGSVKCEDGSISKALTICKGMTGPNKRNNSYAIAKVFNSLDRHLSYADSTFKAIFQSVDF